LALSGWVQIGFQGPSAWRLGLSGLTAYTLVAQFRVWDDLEDREHDGALHPDRVLSEAATLLPFWGLLTTLVLLNCFLLAFALSAAAAFLAVCVGYLAWYRLRTRRGYHLLLLKYPALVTVLALQQGATPHALVLVLIYLTFCIYEVLHDPGSEPGWLNLESVLWCLVAFASAWGAAHRSMQLAVAAATSVALVLMLVRHKKRALEPFEARLVFLLATVQLLNLSRGLS